MRCSRENNQNILQYYTENIMFSRAISFVIWFTKKSYLTFQCWKPKSLLFRSLTENSMVIYQIFFSFFSFTSFKYCSSKNVNKRLGGEKESVPEIQIAYIFGNCYFIRSAMSFAGYSRRNRFEICNLFILRRAGKSAGGIWSERGNLLTAEGRTHTRR